ncbi:c-type cytochrome [Castellaniella sp. S9]|uniref:c-type cytochrome n=1 Tax=Castellaniella sp. S9 TaxID=2993652 RepID=UPI0022B58B63|nr:cytochrome c [Castellaniella sp. S9]
MTDQKTTDSQQRREQPEPYEGSRPVPKLVLTIIGALFVWAAYYIWATYNPMPANLGDDRVAADFAVPVAADGGQLYTANCVACHQASGAGVPGVFPPLAGSEWVIGDPAVAVRIILHGVKGPLTVMGTQYNGEMPHFKEKFSDAELAAVVSHIRTSFGNTAGEVDAKLVQQEREATKDHPDHWNGDEELLPMLKQ